MTLDGLLTFALDVAFFAVFGLTLVDGQDALVSLRGWLDTGRPLVVPPPAAEWAPTPMPGPLPRPGEATA